VTNAQKAGSVSGRLNTDAVFPALYFPKTSSRSKISFHFSSFFMVVVVVVVVLAVNVVETVDEFSAVSLLPLTVIVVIVLPSGDTTVFVSEKIFFMVYSFLYDYKFGRMISAPT